MILEEAKLFLGEDLARTVSLMESVLRSDISLLDATNRSLLGHSGKLLRPVLSLLAAGACGGRTEDSVRFAAAVELLHNATLLHDDVVDGSAERRGRPTVMNLLGSPASVLIGDFWLVKCIGCLLSADRYSEEAVRLFAKTIADLAEGEMLQLQKADDCDTEEEDYFRIIYCKTASLFETACRSAALSVAAPAEYADALARYGRELGMAFQIRDDMLDYGDGVAIGKPTGQDLRERKITMPLLCALGEVSEEEAIAVRKKIAVAGEDPVVAAGVCAFVTEHDGLARAAERRDAFIREAVSCLRILPESEEKSYLVSLAQFVGERNS
jgi:octaprenyl-diphosphate synthase